MRARAVRTDQPTTPTRHGGSKRSLRVRRGRVQPARAASQTSSRRGHWPRRPVSSIASEDLVVEHDPRRRPHTARCASSMPISAVRSTDVFDELYRRAPRLSRRLFGRHGGQVSRPRRALLLGGSAYGGWTCGFPELEGDAPSVGPPSRTPLSQSASALLDVKASNLAVKVHQNCAGPRLDLPSSTWQQLGHLGFMLHACRAWLHRQVSLLVSRLGRFSSTASRAMSQG